MVPKKQKLSHILNALRRCRKRKQKIVFTNGCFDLIHAGHARFLSRAKALGDVLVVGLNSDASVRRLKGTGRPILRLSERVEILNHLRPVDFVIPFSEITPYRLIQKVQPDILIKGGDWEEKDIVGRDVVLKRGGRVISGIFIHGRSTSAIIRAIRAPKRKKTRSG